MLSKHMIPNLLSHLHIINGFDNRLIASNMIIFIIEKDWIVDKLNS